MSIFLRKIHYFKRNFNTYEAFNEKNKGRNHADTS